MLSKGTNLFDGKKLVVSYVSGAMKVTLSDVSSSFSMVSNGNGNPAYALVDTKNYTKLSASSNIGLYNGGIYVGIKSDGTGEWHNNLTSTSNTNISSYDYMLFEAHGNYDITTTINLS